MSYNSLFKKHREQPSSEVFAHFPFNSQIGEKWDTAFENLVRMAKPEKWDFDSVRYKKDSHRFPILTNYLNYTFLRLQKQNKILYAQDNRKACINTGLQTINEKDIFATFFRNNEAEQRSQPEWTFFAFVDSYSDKLKEFSPLPDIASYIEDPTDLVFDTHLDIDVNYEHIYENNESRLPEVLQGNRVLAISAIKGAVELLKEKVRRNYKIAIPHWYEERIQLLLPLNITSEATADLALVADRDKERNIYRIRTVLTMDMAYIDARLITRPDTDWLNP